jgi:hypothetical protein
MYVFKGNIYLEKEHVEIIKNEPEYVKERYFAIAKAIISPPFKIGYRAATILIGVCLRHFYRIVKRFREEGIPGLRLKSTRPKTSPNQTPKEEEDQITAVRSASGFGPNDVAALVNESNRRQGKKKKVWPSTVYNILVREGEIEREHRIQNEWKFFEWGGPNRLIQADLTKFNGVNILTMEDDHGRKGWALALKNAIDTTVTAGMKKLVQIKYDNLLTDNGSQFSRLNAEIRKYCEECINEEHIWTSVHHPQTLGKLSAYQKGLKRFLRHQLGRSRNIAKINHWIRVYNHWYNNGRYHSSIGTYPEVRYSGKRDERWYENIVKALKLENVLTI